MSGGRRYGRVGLGGQDHDRRAPAGGAVAPRGGQARRPAADDHDPVGAHVSRYPDPGRAQPARLPERRTARPGAESRPVTVRSAVIRYVSYVVMIALVAMALFGVLEQDGRARAETAAGTAEVDYPEVTRQGLKPSLVVTVENRDRVAREVSVDLASAYLEGLQLAGVTPDPAESRAVAGDQVRFTFTSVGPGERLRAVFAFSIDQQHPGLRANSPVRVAVGDEDVLLTDITTTVLP